LPVHVPVLPDLQADETVALNFGIDADATVRYDEAMARAGGE